jgi:hypothetical protein
MYPMRRFPITLLTLSALVLLTGPLFAQNRQLQAKKKAQLRAARLAQLQGARAARMKMIMPIMPVQQEASTSLSDEEILKNAKLTKPNGKLDGATLLKFFRQRTMNTANKEQIEGFIQQLGDDEFAVREKASANLVSLGGRAVPYLKVVEKDEKQEVEVQRRAEQCRLLIEGEGGAMVSAAVARALARIKPEGAAEVLLAYLPFAEDEPVADEIRTALGKVAVREGKVEQVLVKALEDKQAVKRAAAAEALCHAGVQGELPAIHKLLKDDEPKVRLRAALGLVPHKDKEAVSTLIALLAEAKLKEDDVSPAEDLLFNLAGEKAPAVDLGSDAEARKKCSQAWAKWWKDNGAKVDLATLGKPQKLLGYTLLVTRDLIWRGGKGGGQNGKVVELDQNNKPRWTIENLNYPVDAQVIGKDRVLITEYQGRKVTERDHKGAVKWTKEVNGWPLSAQRLANGNTFIVMQNQLLEVDNKGKEVFAINRNHDIVKGMKLRNGDVAVVTNQGTYIRMSVDLKTKKEKELKTFNVGWGVQMFGSMDIMTNGHVLVPLPQQNRVVEFNREGKVVWELNMNNGVQWPTAVVRLPNNQTLVASQSTNQVLLFNKKKKLLWRHAADGQLFQARRR